MFMDISKNIRGIAGVSIIVLMFCTLFMNGCGVNNVSYEEDTPEEEISRTIEDNFIDEVEETEEVYVINNTVDELLERVENAENEDRLGRIDDREIFVFKCPDLTTKSFFYSESGILVRYDDYVCVRYEPEKNNEEYILLVYYFDSSDMWESWYKYTVAKDESAAEMIASQERANGYTVWTSENYVMEGELLSDTNIKEGEFLASFENDIVYLRK